MEQSPDNFVSTAEIFEAYETAVRVWTDNDSVSGQTKFLMKRSGFNKVSILQRIIALKSALFIGLWLYVSNKSEENEIDIFLNK